MKRTIFLLSTLSLLQSLFVCYVLEQRFPNSGDEHSYLYQARLFASGHLYAEDPLYDRAQPLNKYLAAFCVTDFGGKRFSEYQPGWPLVLALGVKLGAEWFVAPLLGAALGFLILSYVNRRLGAPLVVPAWTLLALCAFFWFNNAALRAHTLTTLCIFAAFVAFDLAGDGAPGSVLPALAAGALLGFSSVVRYIDWVPLAGWIVWRLFAERRWRELALFGLAFGIPASGNLVYDTLLSGHPLTTPTALYGAPGLHNRLAVSWMGFRVTAARIAKLLYVFPPVFMLALLVRRFPITPRERRHLGLFLGNVGIYFFYPAAVGGPGARYLHAYFPFLVLAVVEIFGRVRAERSRGGWRLWRWMIASQVVCSLIFAANETYNVHQRLDLRRSADRLGADPAIVLLKTRAGNMDIGDLLRNPPQLETARTLYFAWDDDARDLGELVARFPGRRVYTYEYPAGMHAVEGRAASAAAAVRLAPAR